MAINFYDACALVNINPTSRQRRRYNAKRGLAYIVANWWEPIREYNIRFNKQARIHNEPINAAIKRVEAENDAAIKMVKDLMDSDNENKAELIEAINTAIEERDDYVDALLKQRITLKPESLSAEMLKAFLNRTSYLKMTG